MRKNTPAPEGYYEDEGLDALDAEGVARTATLRQRALALLGTSYGISAAVHVALLLILATIMIARPAEPTEARLTVSRALPLPKIDDEAVMDTKDQLPLELPEEVEVPHVVLDEEKLPTVDIPKGEPEAQADKQLTDRFASDAYGVGPGAAGARGDPNGNGRLVAEGGGKPTQDGVRSALRWLANHQQPDGPWRAGRWTEQCRGQACESARHPEWNRGATDVHDVGLTGLALLAFLGNGQTPAVGEFRATVRRGLRWLQAQAAQDGSLGVHGVPDQIYDHAVATMALSEAYLLTKDVGLRAVAQRAADYLVAAQNPGLGWRYGVRSGQNDTSVTGWCVLAIKAARVAGLEVSDESFEGARAWFLRATDSGGETGYMSPGGGSSFLGDADVNYDDLPVNTGVAVLCRLLMGERRSTDVVRRGCKLLLEKKPTWSDSADRTSNFYYWYYGTYAMFQHGGQPWADWNEAMKKALLPSQRTGGCANGSWDANDPWSQVGGRLYATALNALTLEIYYRYDRAQERPGPVAANGPR